MMISTAKPGDVSPHYSGTCHKKSSSWCSVTMVNRFAVSWFLFTVFGSFYCGLVYVLPELYGGFSYSILLCHQIFVYLAFTQMMVNWICIKFVDSSYQPSAQGIHSAQPRNGFTGNGTTCTAQENGSFIISIDNSNNMGRQTKTKGTVYMVSIPTPPDWPEYKAKDPSLVYPYWSWKPCLMCRRQRPPRTHHCPVCKSCILKRDHHCFFTGSCIGLRNQRHFMVFNFWSSLTTTYCLIHSLIYLYVTFLQNNSYWDLLVPINIIRWCVGHITLVDCTMVLILYSLMWFWMTSLGFFLEQVRIVRKGITSFEEDNKIKIITTNTKAENIQEVFGENWWLNFIVPLHWMYKNSQNGIDWPNVKA